MWRYRFIDLKINFENYWVNDRSGIKFVLFGYDHLFALFLGAFLLLLIFIFKNKLKKSIFKYKILYGLAGLLIFCEMVLQYWYITVGRWALHFSLPLQLCSIAMITCSIMLITRSYKLFEFNYFAGIGGAIMALLTPELVYGFPHVIFLLFFISHFGIIAASLFMMVTMDYKPSLKSIGRASLWLNVILIPIFIVNASTGANYMFLMRKPGTASLLDLMGPWPWYILVMEALALIVFLLLYVPFIFINKKRVG